jgi:hypothetical protein
LVKGVDVREEKAIAGTDGLRGNVAQLARAAAVDHVGRARVLSLGCDGEQRNILWFQGSMAQKDYSRPSVCHTSEGVCVDVGYEHEAVELVL